MVLLAAPIVLTNCSDPAGDWAQASCASPPEFAFVEGGHLKIGSPAVYWEEGPAREVAVAAFRISSTEVTNDAFEAFVNMTGYVTIAERTPNPEDYPDIPEEKLKPGSAVFKSPASGSNAGWWHFVEGAYWRAPTGPGSNIDGLSAYPVRHIAKQDAGAFAAWKGCRLPTEAEWEYAARSGRSGKMYAWGDAAEDRVSHANTWQGLFPYADTAADGYGGLAPVACYPPNEFGLFDLSGNVWEWVSNAFPGDTDGYGMIKGGSYLCSDNFCARYRPAARQPQENNFSASHIGFRIVCDPLRPNQAPSHE